MEIFNISEGEILDRLNSEERQKFTGGIIFIGVLTAVGIVGNLHVLIVYPSKMKPSNHKTFIFCLGIVDMIACAIGMPLTIVNLIKPLTFRNNFICKAGQHLNYFMSGSSGMILLVITIDRYRKICRPMEWQLSNRMAKIVCIITICVSYGLTLPIFFLFGLNSFQTKYANITAVHCSTDSKYIATNIPTIVNAALMIVAAVTFVVLITLYVAISRVIMARGTVQHLQRRKRASSRFTVPSLAISTVDLSDESLQHPNSSMQAESAMTTSACNSTLNCTYSSSNGSRQNLDYQVNMKNQALAFKETKRMTIIFFIIVAIFFFGYLPNLILTVYIYTNNYDFFHQLTKQRAVLYNTFKWFFYINNVANPIVYVFLDVKFRAEIKSFYCKIFK